MKMEDRLISELRQLHRERDRLHSQVEQAEAEIARHIRDLIGIDVQMMSSRRLAALYATTRMLVESSTVHEAAPKVLRALGESEGWDLGVLWLVDTQENVLRYAAGWHAPSVEFTRFETLSRNITFERAIGLPGQAWASGKPKWIEDVVKEPKFPRAEAAAQEGLHGAIGFPIWTKDTVIGVIEFFDHKVREPDEGQQRMVTIISTQIGQFIEQTRAKEEIVRQKRCNDLILGSAGEGIYGLDEQGRATFINPAGVEVLGYERNEVIGKVMHLLTHHSKPDGSPYPREECPIYAAFQDGEVHEVTNEVFWRKNGTSFPVEYVSTPIRENGSLVGAVVAFRDITERIEKERLQRERIELLEQTDQMKDQFLSVISHELRTPLNFITGFASILSDELAGPLNDQQHQYLAKIQLGSDQLLEILNNLIDASRMIAGKFKVYPTETDYLALVDEALVSLKPAADKRHLHLEHDLHVPQTVWADSIRIKQVLTNLVDNGITFTPEGGRVLVKSYLHEETLVTEVSDTGMGIAIRDIPKLFTRFYQLDMSDTREVGGTGLGLAITKAIVEAHGGQIGARSEGPGKGSTFWFTLPPNPASAH